MTVDELPRVSGRHKNRPLACLRREKAMRMIAEGKTYQQVADELGYANRGTVWRLVQKAMREHLQPVAEQSRREIADRLDEMQSAIWDRAMSGEIAALRECRNIIMARIKLFGLDQEDPVPAKPRTVVVDPADLASGRVDVDKAFA
jgi:hypothetical protein